jgi:hypothetical protein
MRLESDRGGIILNGLEDESAEGSLVYKCFTCESQSEIEQQSLCFVSEMRYDMVMVDGKSHI